MSTSAHIPEMNTYLDSHAPEQLQFLVDLCEQNSHTHHKDGVDRIGQMILERLPKSMTTERILRQQDRGDHLLLGNRADGSAIYLIGHLDTVFPPDHPFQVCHLDEEQLIGPGTADMKGGLAVFVYALKALEVVGLLDQLSIRMILNADEEDGSVTSQALICQERTRAIACICGECAGPSGEIVLSRNGKLGMRIDTYGRERHVGRGSHEKASAILELARVIIALESLNALLPGASINVGKIEGGLGPAAVAGHAMALVDVRWTQDAHRPLLMKRIEEELATTTHRDCRREFRVLNSRPAWPRTDATGELFADLQRVARQLDQQIAPEHRRGTSDASFFGSRGLPTLDGFGPIGGGDHTSGEFILVPSLIQRTTLLAAFLAARSQCTA